MVFTLGFTRIHQDSGRETSERGGKEEVRGKKAAVVQGALVVGRRGATRVRRIQLAHVPCQ